MLQINGNQEELSIDRIVLAYHRVAYLSADELSQADHTFLFILIRRVFLTYCGFQAYLSA